MKNPNTVTEMEGATLRRPTNSETIRQRAFCQCGSSVGLAALPLLAFASFTFLPLARAVSPPPDGCYPGLTTAEGCAALFSITTGQGNTAIGHDALFSDTTGSWNTGVGAVALGFNDGDFNTAVGVAGLLLNTSGTENTAVGTATLVFNATGNFNTATGAFALLNHATGDRNTAVGTEALVNDLGGVENTAVGYQALFHNTTIGGVSGTFNNAIGSLALYGNTTGHFNTAVGDAALYTNTTASDNTALGSAALAFNVTGTGNTGIGRQALLHSTGNGNTALGAFALGVSVGDGNIGVGNDAGGSLTTGDHNIYIGSNVGTNVESNQIRIGVQGTQLATFVAGISGTAVTGTAVVVNPNGQLGVAPSSERFKNEIKPMDNVSEAILALKPVTFSYKQELDPDHLPQFGLVAEEVEKVNPDLVAHGCDGKPYTVRYEAVNAMLLNEFLKEHRLVQQQGATIEQQQRQIEALAAGLQKVSAQIEISKPAPRVVLNNP